MILFSLHEATGMSLDGCGTLLSVCLGPKHRSLFFVVGSSAKWACALCGLSKTAPTQRHAGNKDKQGTHTATVTVTNRSKLSRHWRWNM